MESVKRKETEILIVDDNTQYIQLLIKMLKYGFGYEKITTADSVESGYKMISSDPQRYNLLFVDFRFPSGETGGDLLRQLQQGGLLKDKVAFLITSEPTVDNVKEASNAGALGVVAKPFDRAELAKQLDKADRAIQAEKEESF